MPRLWATELFNQLSLSFLGWLFSLLGGVSQAKNVNTCISLQITDNKKRNIKPGTRKVDAVESSCSRINMPMYKS